MDFPAAADDLQTAQRHLARAEPPPYHAPAGTLAVAAVFTCFGRGGEDRGSAGDRGWVGAVVMESGRTVDAAIIAGSAGAPYAPGLLALREGPLLAAAVAPLRAPFDVLLVNATGRDHPRRAGLALHLGAVLGTPTAGVTHRPLLAAGDWPAGPERGARSPLRLDGDIVGFWVRTRAECRPLATHAAWRTDPESAAAVVLRTVHRARTPEPLRQARRLARTARTQARGASA